MKQNWQQAVLPHVYAILLFLGLAFLFCSPVMQGLEIKQSDTVQWQAMSQEARSYHEKTGINPIWTNAMFGGMPTYQIFMAQDNYTYYIHNLLTLGLPKPVNFFFLAMVGFYFLMCVMRFRTWISIIGAIAFGFASYNAMIIFAGHDTKMFTLSYMAPMLAGILLAYRGKYWIGGIITCITLGLMITSGHYQMLYYMLIICACIGIVELVTAIREKTLPSYAKATGILVVFGALSVLPSTVTLWTTAEYSKYTMRGGHSELTPIAGSEANKTAGGLDKDYAFQWSEGPFETLTILSPNLYGGPTMGKLSTSSETYKTIIQLGVPVAQAEQVISQMPRYWGPQPMTDAGIYWGAVIIFLFVLALFTIKSPHKWWVLSACIIGVFLAWGDNFPIFNYFVFDHLPLYSKFRAPSQALIIPQLLVPFFACWALNEVTSGTIDKQLLLKNVKKALYITGGLCLLILVASYGMLDFTSADDRAKTMYQQFAGGNQQVFDQLMNAIKADRASLLRTDALRSLAFILVAAGLLWAVAKDKLKLNLALAIMTAAVAIDQIPVAYRTLNKESYVTPTDYRNAFAPSAIDEAIHKDPDPYYRVFNSVNFMDAMSSYHHKAVGGYSPAKLALYQDLIDHQITKNNMRVLDMLNTKYIIFPDQSGQQLTYQRNPNALGNAWFVDSIIWAANADQEMKTLDSLAVDHAAVIDQRFKPQMNGYTPGKDSSSNIKLTQYGLNQLNYQSSNSQPGFAVFSDIYYPAGWKAFVDGKETEILRVNYLLRGIKVPAGQHKLEMKFEPRSYYLGNTITRWSSIVMLLLLAGAIANEIRKSIKKNKAI